MGNLLSTEDLADETYATETGVKPEKKRRRARKTAKRRGGGGGGSVAPPTSPASASSSGFGLFSDMEEPLETKEAAPESGFDDTEDSNEPAAFQFDYDEPVSKPKRKNRGASSSTTRSRRKKKQAWTDPEDDDDMF